MLMRQLGGKPPAKAAAFANRSVQGVITPPRNISKRTSGRTAEVASGLDVEEGIMAGLQKVSGGWTGGTSDG